VTLTNGFLDGALYFPKVVKCITEPMNGLTPCRAQGREKKKKKEKTPEQS